MTGSKGAIALLACGITALYLTRLLYNGFRLFFGNHFNGKRRQSSLGLLPGTGFNNRGVAQWLARFVRDEEVGGSNPLTPTTSYQQSPFFRYSPGRTSAPAIRRGNGFCPGPLAVAGSIEFVGGANAELFQAWSLPQKPFRSRRIFFSTLREPA